MKTDEVETEDEMAATTPVCVYVNDDREKWFATRSNEYRPKDENLTQALAFYVEDAPDAILCEQVFGMLNSPWHSPLGTLTVPMLRKYHQRFPSLSVGDVVECDGRRYLCVDLGFRPLL